MPKGKKKKRKPSGASMKLRVPPPLPESGNPVPDVSDSGIRLMARYAEKIKKVPMEHCMRLHEQLYAQYNQELTRRFEARHGILSRMDTIDISTKTSIDPDINHETIFTCVPDPILSATPCYEKGILRIDPNVFIYFEVKELDLEGGKIKIFLHAFRTQTVAGNVVEPGISGTMLVSAYVDGDQPKLRVQNPNAGDMKFFTDLYTELSPRELGWTADDVDYWQRVIVQNASNQLQRYRNQRIDPLENLGRQFCAYIAIVNVILERSKPKLLPDDPDQDTPENKSQDSGQKPEKKILNPAPQKPYDPDRPRVRVVQGVRFTSRHPPKKAAQAIRQYKTPAWTVRGHTRTYKSGKTAYIKPGVRRRKGLADATPQQSILRVKDPDIRKENKP